MNGFIKLHKAIKTWEWYDHPTVFTVFIHLLIEANYEDKVWKGMNIPRGSLVTSYANMAKMTGLSIQQVRTALFNLKSTQELTIKPHNKYTEISINNYDSYQSSTSKTSSVQQTNNKQITTTKEYKEIKKERNIYGKQVLEKFNLVFETKYTNTDSIEKNLEEWLKVYSLDLILESIEKARHHGYWGDKLTPTMLFRQKDAKGEAVDRIGEFLNTHEKKAFVDHEKLEQKKRLQDQVNAFKATFGES